MYIRERAFLDFICFYYYYFFHTSFWIGKGGLLEEKTRPFNYICLHT